jgi:hypothetical protein
MAHVESDTKWNRQSASWCGAVLWEEAGSESSGGLAAAPPSPRRGVHLEAALYAERFAEHLVVCLSHPLR